MSAAARRWTIAAVLVAVVGAGSWSLTSSEMWRGTGEARARFEATTAGAKPGEAPTPRRRETAPDASADESATRLETPPRPETLTIHVLSADEDAPIAGATVRAMKDYGGRETIATAAADATGVARITIEHGLDSVRDFLVRGPGFVQTRCGVPDRANGGDAETTVRLKTGTVLDGVVVDAKTGAPLAGARVVAKFGGERVAGFGLPELPYDQVVTGADGTFRLDGIPPSAEVNVEAALRGCVTQNEDWKAYKPRRLEFRLEPSGGIRGVVRDAEGKLAAGVSVECACGSASTRDDGTYEIMGLPLDEAYDVFAKKGDPAERASSVARGVRVTDEAPTAVQDLVLLQPANLIVRVRTDTGQVSPNAGVMLESESIRCWRNNDGSDDIDFVVAQPGRCHLTVYAPTFVTRLFDVVIEQGATERIDAVLEHGLSLRGVVVDEAGGPVAHAAVSAKRRDDAPWLRQGAGTREDGSFWVTGCSAGSYDLSVTAAGHEDATIESVVAPADGLRIVLASAPEGSLTFALRGLPADSHDVRVDLTFHPADARASFSEAFEWNAGERPDIVERTGKYDVVLSVDGFAPVKRHVEVAAGVTSDLGEIVLDRGVVVSGLVVDPQGRPVEGACVRAFLDVDRADYVAWTDAAGAFRLFRVPLGNVQIAIDAPGFVRYMFGWTAGAVAAPDAAPFEWMLVRGGVLKGRILDPGRRYDPTELEVGAWDRFSNMSGETDSAEVDEHGAFALRLAPGSWRLRVRGRTSLDLGTKDVEVREGEDTSVEIVLDK